VWLISLCSKIDQYVKWWRGKYEGSWPPFHRFEGLDVSEAGSCERAVDFLLYRLLRAFDRFTAMCFCRAPLQLLRRYRERKYNKATRPAAAITHPEPVAA
jgi:hypothetical protein